MLQILLIFLLLIIAKNRKRKPPDSRVDGAPATKRASVPSAVWIQFPGERSLERFLQTKRNVWDNEDRELRLVHIHQPNQPLVFATTAEHANKSLLPANACSIVLLPVLLPGALPASFHLASAEFLCHCHSDSQNLSVPPELSPSKDDHYVVIPHETGFAAVSTDSYIPPFTDDRTILLVSVEKIQDSSTMNEQLLDQDSKHLADLVSNAADRLLRLFEMKPDSKAPDIIQELVNPPNIYPTP